MVVSVRKCTEQTSKVKEIYDVMGYKYVPFHQNGIYRKVRTKARNVLVCGSFCNLHGHAECFGNRFQCNCTIPHLNPGQSICIRVRSFVGYQSYRDIGNVNLHFFGERFLDDGNLRGSISGQTNFIRNLLKLC